MSYSLKSIKISSKIGKKYDAKFINKESGREKNISFGAKGYRDYTLISKKTSKYYISDKTERDKVKSNYRKRHAKDLTTSAGKTGVSAGALSYYVLWSSPSLAEGIRNYKSRYNF